MSQGLLCGHIPGGVSQLTHEAVVADDAGQALKGAHVCCDANIYLLHSSQSQQQGGRVYVYE